MDHETRYEYAAAWLDIVRRLWTADDEFDYAGRVFRIEKGFHQPKPLQRPHPPVMNAGRSGTGNRFAAKYADVVFIAFWEERSPRGRSGRGRDAAWRVKSLAVRSKCGARPSCCAGQQRRRCARNCATWSKNRVTGRPSTNLARIMRVDNPMCRPTCSGSERRGSSAATAAFLLVGTREQTVDELRQLAAGGVDGLVLSWVNYRDELRQFIAEILPLIEQGDLRTPMGLGVPG
jgi:alkanesulfonate monooxygenase SsuD/methylene tetrahydromethanopterin reductase-like flavin-dependent oxidoreductase (luciferase family)